MASALKQYLVEDLIKSKVQNVDAVLQEFSISGLMTGRLRFSEIILKPEVTQDMLFGTIPYGCELNGIVFYGVSVQLSWMDRGGPALVIQAQHVEANFAVHDPCCMEVASDFFDSQASRLQDFFARVAVPNKVTTVSKLLAKMRVVVDKVEVTFHKRPQENARRTTAWSRYGCQADYSDAPPRLQVSIAGVQYGPADVPPADPRGDAEAEMRQAFRLSLAVVHITALPLDDEPWRLETHEEVHMSLEGFSQLSVTRVACSKGAQASFPKTVDVKQNLDRLRVPGGGASDNGQAAAAPQPAVEVIVEVISAILAGNQLRDMVKEELEADMVSACSGQHGTSDADVGIPSIVISANSGPGDGHPHARASESEVEGRDSYVFGKIASERPTVSFNETEESGRSSTARRASRICSTSTTRTGMLRRPSIVPRMRLNSMAADRTRERLQTAKLDHAQFAELMAKVAAESELTDSSGQEVDRPEEIPLPGAQKEIAAACEDMKKAKPSPGLRTKNDTGTSSEVTAKVRFESDQSIDGDLSEDKKPPERHSLGAHLKSWLVGDAFGEESVTLTDESEEQDFAESAEWDLLRHGPLLVRSVRVRDWTMRVQNFVQQQSGTRTKFAEDHIACGVTTLRASNFAYFTRLRFKYMAEQLASHRKLWEEGHGKDAPTGMFSGACDLRSGFAYRNIDIDTLLVGFLAAHDDKDKLNSVLNLAKGLKLRERGTADPVETSRGDLQVTEVEVPELSASELGKDAVSDLMGALRGAKCQDPCEQSVPLPMAYSIEAKRAEYNMNGREKHWRVTLPSVCIRNVLDGGEDLWKADALLGNENPVPNKLPGLLGLVMAASSSKAEAAGNRTSTSEAASNKLAQKLAAAEERINELEHAAWQREVRGSRSGRAAPKQSFWMSCCVSRDPHDDADVVRASKVFESPRSLPPLRTATGQSVDS